MAPGKRQSMADLLAKQRLTDGATVGEQLAAAEPALVAGALASVPAAVPMPREPLSESGPLAEAERADLEVCEAALDRLRLAFAAAGKALQVIRDARLYRETHDTFEAYVAERWDMSRASAYRLIDAWPLAEALSPIGDTRLNEGQIRELLPVADRHGQDAAVTVYRTIAETDGVRLTAAVIKGAVQVIPRDRFDPARAVEQIRAYLAGEIGPAAHVVSVGDQVERVRAQIRRIKVDVVRAAGREAATELAAELRRLADEMEQPQ